MISQSILQSLSICLVYGFFSMAFSFSAKFLFRFYGFKNTFMLLLYEATGNILICTTIYIIKDKKYMIKDERNEQSLIELIRSIIKNRISQSMKTFPYSIAYGCGVVCGMKALSLVNIPMFLALRRTLIFFVFIFGLIFGNSKQMSVPFGASIVLITSGAVIAGYQHLNDDLYGYGLVILNNCLSSIGLHLAKNLNTTQKLEPLELVMNNSLNLWPIFLTLACISGDFTSFLKFEPLYSTEFIVCLTIVAIFGFCLNFCTNLCTMRNSPFAIALTHNIKDIFSTSLSLMMFKDIQIDMFLLGGILLSFSGSFVYSYMKLKELKIENAYDYQQEDAAETIEITCQEDESRERTPVRQDSQEEIQL